VHGHCLSGLLALLLGLLVVFLHDLPLRDLALVFFGYATIDGVAKRRAQLRLRALIKTGASMRPVSKKRDDTSVLSGRSMREIAEAADATWQSNRRGAA
jgi:hypothetical protein